MHVTTAIEEAVHVGFAEDFNIEDKDLLTGLLNLTLLDDYGDFVIQFITL
jgi:hypothetical protein